MHEIHRLDNGLYVIAFTTHCGWWDQSLKRPQYKTYTEALRARDRREASIARTKTIWARRVESIADEIKHRGGEQARRIAAARAADPFAVYDAEYNEEYRAVLELLMIATANEARTEDENDMLRNTFAAYFPDVR